MGSEMCIRDRISGPDTKGQESSAAQSRATSPFRAEASALNRPKLGRLGKHLHRKSAKPAAATTDQTLHTDSPAPMNTDKDNEHQDKHMCEPHTPVEVTRSLPNEITASSAAANGQAPVQQEQQTPMTLSHQTLGQSSTLDRSAQAVTPVELGQLPQADLQQSHTMPIREQTAQRCGNKDSQQHQAPATPLQIEDAAAEPIPQNRDKETQVTVSNRDAMVQTDTPT